MLGPEVIYEDQALLVLNKPAGLAVHADGYSLGPFLTDWLVEKYAEIKEVGEDRLRPGIVHRLDKDTSGIMVVAKTADAYQFLKEQFKARTVGKEYLAILVGKFKEGVGMKGVIDWPIGRSRRDPRVRVASKKAAGVLRPAETRYEVLAESGEYSLVKAELLTGRTHQLRAHFKALQHPIAADELYGTGGERPGGLGRQALHAWRLTLALPKGERRAFMAPPPEDFKLALALFNFKC